MLDRYPVIVCEDTGMQAIRGECPFHHGDACLVSPYGLHEELKETRKIVFEAKSKLRDFAKQHEKFP
jgi:hypothetical protein